MENELPPKNDDDPFINWLIWSSLGLGILAATALGVWWLLRPMPPGRQLAVCKSNLKNIGTAYEMYATDNQGKYPPSIILLTPNYLKNLPQCPAASNVTYRVIKGPNAPLNKDQLADYYYVECVGANHLAAQVVGNYPAYDPVDGVINQKP